MQQRVSSSALFAQPGIHLQLQILAAHRTHEHTSPHLSSALQLPKKLSPAPSQLMLTPNLGRGLEHINPYFRGKKQRPGVLRHHGLAEGRAPGASDPPSPVWSTSTHWAETDPTSHPILDQESALSTNYILKCQSSPFYSSNPVSEARGRKVLRDNSNMGLIFLTPQFRDATFPS